jgi:transaldolase/glucose-6-phosphate isomerase
MNPIHELHELGQSVWLDYIRRDLIDSGELAKRAQDGELRGVTSNPTIFESAISGSDLYNTTLRPLAHAGWEPESIVDALMVDDIRAAADVFLPLYEATNGGDGFVSIEVDPRIADDTEATEREVERIWRAVNRPNVMVKIPATSAGIPAIEKSIRRGINVNVTLIFALERYAEVMEAYLSGIRARIEAGQAVDHIASVASFFVSRVDTAVDRKLEDILREEGPNAERAASLMGKAAIANAKLAYAQFKATFASAHFEMLAAKGARVQRPLWASTSTKNPSYPDTYYVDNLVGSDTVNTLPPATLNAFKDHGDAQPSIEENISASRAQLEALESLGISMVEVTDQLEREGVKKFSDSYLSLLGTIRERCLKMRSELAPFLEQAREAWGHLERDSVSERIWQRDPKLWIHRSSKGDEVRNRLGWLDLTQTSWSLLDELSSFTAQIKRAGISNAVLLGMGGSSLSADVMRRMLASGSGLDFHVLDSTHPAMIRRIARKAPVYQSLFIVASKSGSTVEPLALMEYFWNRAKRRRGEKAGEHFVVVTDPGTHLEQVAKERGYRRVFPSPSDVGGRYSALSVFGLLPAALMDVEPQALLEGGGHMAVACRPEIENVRNPGIYLGGLIGAAGMSGRGKLNFIADKDLESFVDWIEQLLAESSGKEGRGFLPIVGEPPGRGGAYGEDQLLLYLRSDGSYDSHVDSWIDAKVPVVVLEMQADPYALGQAFFQWEMAVAVACHLIEVNAFDQPNVQRAKDRAEALMKTYQRRGSLPDVKTLWEREGWKVRGESDPGIASEAKNLEAALASILVQAGRGEVINLLAYLPYRRSYRNRIKEVRRKMREGWGRTSTFNYGPRYLHSTGQIHKGGPDNAVHMIITAPVEKDEDIPRMGLPFGILQKAQAIGDLQALNSLGRRAYGIELPSEDHFKEFATRLGSSIERLVSG